MYVDAVCSNAYEHLNQILILGLCISLMSNIGLSRPGDIRPNREKRLN